MRIRKASAEDVPLILKFIRKLAEYERLTHEVVATEESVRQSLFGPHPAGEVLLAYEGDEPVGFAVYYENFSTFLGLPGIYLEDLFVEPSHRGKGYGKALFAATARAAHERGGRMNWAVLKWNQPSIEFYKKLGAIELDEWHMWRLAGEPLRRVAEAAP